MEQDADVIADSLLSGDDPGCLSQEDLDSAKNILTIRKENFIKEGNIDEVRKIQSVMEKISTCEKQKKQSPKKREVTQLPKLTKRQQNATESDNNSPPAKETVEKLANGEMSYDEVETKDISALITETKKIVKELSSQRKLIEAQQYEDVNNNLRALNNQRKSDDKTHLKETNLENQIEPIEQSINEKKNELETSIQEFDAETLKMVSEMIDKNEEKYSAYDDETDKNLPKEVKKPSPELLNIRKKADYLIQLRRFADAALYDEEASELGKVELENAIGNYYSERKIKKDGMIKEDNEKLKIFKIKRESKRNELIRDGNKEIEKLEKTANNLKGRQQSKPKPKPKIPPVTRTAKASPFATQRLLMPLGRRPASTKISRPPSNLSNKC